MTWVTVIGTAITLILGPLLAYFLANLAKDALANVAADKRQAAEEELNRKLAKDLADKTRIQNESIDAQAKARADWLAKAKASGSTDESGVSTPEPHQ